jgi:hypothetical protein
VKTASGCLRPKNSNTIPTDMKRITLATLCAALLIVGCGHNNAIVGKWKADSIAMPADKSNPGAGSLKGAESLFSFEFKNDGTFVGPMSMEGTYTVSGNTVELTTTKIMGMDTTKTGSAADHAFHKAELSADGKTLTIHSPKPSTTSTGSGDLKLTREAGQ